jgi:hypothetical protein
MHLICRMEVPLPDMPCARQLNRKKTILAREPVAKTASAVFGLAISYRKLLLCSSKAVVAELVEHELPKLGVAGSNPVAYSILSTAFLANLAFFSGKCRGKGRFS